MADDEIIIIVDDEPDTVDLSVEAGDNEDISADAPEVQNDVTEEVEGDKYYTDLAKQWAIASTLILGEDYSSKYYANQAKNYKIEAATSETNAGNSATSANNSKIAAASSASNAHIWAEGTDEEVEALGGTHSSKEWVNYIMENAPTVTAEQTATGAEITVTDVVHGATTVELLNGADGQDGQDGAAATIAVGTVTTGAAGSSATVTNSGTSSAAVFDFTIPKGDKGDKGDTGNTGATGATGATGNGIVGTQKTGTSGLVDTYTITYTNGNTDTFTVTNGQNGTGSVSDVRVNNVSVLTNNVANIDLTNYVDKTSNQSITGTKTFVGQKKIGFKQSNNTDKLGFTLYANNNTEKGYLEFNPANTVDSVPLMTLGNFASSAAGLTHVGFRKYSGISGANGAYNLLTPLISDAKTPFNLTTTYTNFYLPLGFTDGTTTVKTAKSGLVDLSSILPAEVTETTVTGWGFTKNAGTVTSVNNISPDANGDVTLSIPSISNLADKDLSNLSATGEAKFQEPLVSGTNIKTINSTSLLGSGNIDADDVFIATYGTTTYQDVLDAYNAGKQIYVDKTESSNINRYDFNSYTGTVFEFVRVVGNVTYALNLYSSIGWGSTTTYDLAKTDLSNLSATGQDIIDGKADTDLTNVTDTGYIKMAGASMPSNTYKNLTLGASGSTYAAPADGWFYINKSAVASGTYIVLENTSNNMQSGLIAGVGGQTRASLPVCKGDIITVTYSVTGATNTFRFIYAVGSESEAS